MTKIKLSITILLVFIGCILEAQNPLSITHLRCESRVNPLGIMEKRPHFSWWINSAFRDSKQLAYWIQVAETEDQLNNGKKLVWDSKYVQTDASIQVIYDGTLLDSGKKYFWRVKIKDQKGIESDWSSMASFQMGLFSTSDWIDAQWISYENLPDSMKVVPGVHGSGDKLGNKASLRSTVPLFRKEFKVAKKIKEAILSICGLGQYEAFLNGDKLGKGFLTPGWTDYDKRCLYNTFDVTAQIQSGTNVLGVIVGNGFYNISRERYRKLVIAYGYPKMISKLKLNYLDGTSAEIVSGINWKCSPSPIEFSSIYGGEDYNATKEQKGWNLPGFDESGWKSALSASVPKGELTSESDYPVTVNQTIAVKSIEQKGVGRYLYDFGQNASGILELQVSGKKGSVIKLIPGELITKEKEINQRASGSPFYYSYTLKGDGQETWRPRFSYYGFRYVMVEGAVPAEGAMLNDFPHVVQLRMLHTCNSSEKNGEFSCSNPLFNQIYTLIDWAIRSNLQSVVTDCPHREKLGWLEQTYLMGASLQYNYGLSALYKKAVTDMMDAQTAEGLVPDIAPEYTQFNGGFRDSPEWGSASVLLPWMLWEWYGDRTTLEKALPMMQKYVAYLGTKANGNILDYGLGDWFDYGPKSPGEAQLTPKSLTATAIYYYDIQLLSRMMKICKRVEEAGKLDALAQNVKISFNARFFDVKTKVYSTGSQTAMSMPLCVGMVDDIYRKPVFDHLVASVSSSGFALTAGDIGFHFLVKALEEGGGSEILYNMNCRNDLPGYGFQLKKGATALTESWPALEEVSNNHLMLGHLMEWFYSGLGGIRQEEGSTAFKKIVISPLMVGDLTQARANYLSPYGRITSEWRKGENSIEMEVEIPANTTATIVFPFSSKTAVFEKGREVVLSIDSEGKFYCKVGSGNFSFKMKQ